MDLLLVSGLIHIIGGLVWAGSVAVLGLILLSVADGSDHEAARRAVDEAALIDRCALRPAMLATVAGGGGLAWAAGALPGGWALVVLALMGATLTLGITVLRPAVEMARHVPGPASVRRVLGLAAIHLAPQAAALALLVLRPGMSEIILLGGLVACLGLAVALARTPGEEPARAA